MPAVQRVNILLVDDKTENLLALESILEAPDYLLVRATSGQEALLALLSDGAAWSTSALALALEASQRTVQRALADLEAEGRVRAIGNAVGYTSAALDDSLDRYANIARVTLDAIQQYANDVREGKQIRGK